MRSLIAVLALFPLVSIAADMSPALPDKELVSELRKGGYVIYIRHPKTNPDQADIDPLNLDNVKAQRQLSDDGRRQAKTIGESLRALKIPVSQVITSKFYRAYEAGKLLEVADVTTSVDISEGGLVVSPNENMRRTKALQQLLGTSPVAGKNVVLVSHKPNAIDAVGAALLDIREAETVVFKPLGDGKFSLVGRVTADKWPELAK